MALDLSKLNFFSRLDARARVFVLLGAVVGVVFLIYAATVYFAAGSKTIGPSQVASAPKSLQSIPGGQLTAEYSKALQQANTQSSQQAQMSGGSAVPTLMNFSQPSQASSASCVICTDQSANAKVTLDDWVRQGKIAPEVSSALQALMAKNVSVDDYAAALDKMVKEGKLTPEQARELLEQYKKQHANKLIDESAASMDQLIKSGKLPLDVANQLLDAQKEKLSPTEYAAMLQEMVREGKLSPEAAAQLLAQYKQQHDKEVVAGSIASIRQLARNGQLIPEIENDLIDLETRMVPLDLYSSTLDKYVASGKLIPAVASKILDEFKSQKASMVVSATLDRLLKNADEKTAKKLRDMADKLGALQANNAPVSAYMDELKRQVEAGTITPEQAMQLLQEYEASTSKAPTEITPGATTDAFAKLQQRVAENAVTVAQPTVPTAQFSTAQLQSEQAALRETQARIDAIQTAMSGQAGQLVNAWQPVVMMHKEGTPETSKTKSNATATGASATDAGATTTSGIGGGVPLIKSGTIIFAVLDTTANSDYPDSPVMATVVDGQYKGAKLMGKLVTTKGVSGQQDRIALNFTLMNEDNWPKSKAITAYGIDPDTARTVMASQVDYHYLQRFGAMMATSFLQGYASAITNAGTSTTGIFGTSTTHPTLSPSSKIMTALGQMGQTVGTATANYINIPPTVKVDAGVGLGILFMSDVT